MAGWLHGETINLVVKRGLSYRWMIGWWDGWLVGWLVGGWVLNHGWFQLVGGAMPLLILNNTVENP